jgi:hypothetical protein
MRLLTLLMLSAKFDVAGHPDWLANSTSSYPLENFYTIQEHNIISSPYT